ncbi:MAG TPA: molybdopterin-guanine dinucleotide biosynthesis protein MobB [Ottowia sp.]|nr:molybdopterin-guanine dinucleotide biosynthesis protein MobB [Ottowia sp.]
MHELRGDPEPSPDLLLGHMAPCDLVLVEGFKGGDFPKLEVWRTEDGKSTLPPHLTGHRHDCRRRTDARRSRRGRIGSPGCRSA